MDTQAKLKILFLHNNKEDYLSASLFHGLRTLLGENCVDFPRFDCMYLSMTDEARSSMRGFGFTLYGLLPDLPRVPEMRRFWQRDLGQYDYVVISDVWSNWNVVRDIRGQIDADKIIVLDGSDASTLFPNAFHLRSQPLAYFTPIRRDRYFKRELIPGASAHPVFRPLMRALGKDGQPPGVQPISFSVPQEKIWKEGASSYRTKDFPAHIVDAEIAQVANKDKSQAYVFTKEDDYYADLRISRFGVTTKRAGWDCLRHYELAANGCVLCFRDLDHKPISCAPHGLNDSNCVIYRDYEDLRRRLSSLTENEYAQLRDRTYDWITANTTAVRAAAFLAACCRTAP